MTTDNKDIKQTNLQDKRKPNNRDLHLLQITHGREKQLRLEEIEKELLHQYIFTINLSS